MTYQIYFTQIAAEMLESVKDKRIQCECIQKLCVEPEQQGKELSGKLSGFRSVRAVGQKYRIIYRTDNIRVVIVGVGLRKGKDRSDIYRLVGSSDMNDL